MKVVTSMLIYSAEKRVPLQELSKWYPMWEAILTYPYCLHNSCVAQLFQHLAGVK